MYHGHRGWFNLNFVTSASTAPLAVGIKGTTIFPCLSPQKVPVTYLYLYLQSHVHFYFSKALGNVMRLDLRPLFASHFILDFLNSFSSPQFTF